MAGDSRRQRPVKENRMLDRDKVYDGALEDILHGNVIAILY